MSTEAFKAARDFLYESLVRVHPQLAGVAVTHAWGGNVAITFDRMPQVGVLDGVHYATGCDVYGQREPALHRHQSPRPVHDQRLLLHPSRRHGACIDPPEPLVLLLRSLMNRLAYLVVLLVGCGASHDGDDSARRMATVPPKLWPITTTRAAPVHSQTRRRSSA